MAVSVQSKDTGLWSSGACTLLIDLGMEFGIPKCAVVTKKREKCPQCCGVQLPKNEEMKEPGERGYR